MLNVSISDESKASKIVYNKACDMTGPVFA